MKRHCSLQKRANGLLLISVYFVLRLYCLFVVPFIPVLPTTKQMFCYNKTFYLAISLCNNDVSAYLTYSLLFEILKEKVLSVSVSLNQGTVDLWRRGILMNKPNGKCSVQ